MSRSAATARTDRPPAAADRGLARSSGTDLRLAWQHRDALVLAAVAVVAACGHDPDVARCTSAGCHLAGLSDGEAVCAVAHALSRVPDAPRLRVVPSAAEVVAEFRAQLVAAADAIRHCRQAEHGTGVCWFSPIPGDDGCRPVLRLLHAAS